MDLNTITRFWLRLLAVAAVLGAMVYAGRADYNEEVYSEMGLDTRNEIKAELGDAATDSEVVDYYMENRGRWK